MDKKIRVKNLFILILIYIVLSTVAYGSSGKALYVSRCAMCHGQDARASGYLANKSRPSTPDLATCKFQKRLAQYPGVIISSIVLRPNDTLIPDTLRLNSVHVPSHIWTDKELRSINQYILILIAKQPACSK